MDSNSSNASAPLYESDIIFDFIIPGVLLNAIVPSIAFSSALHPMTPYLFSQGSSCLASLPSTTTPAISLNYYYWNIFPYITPIIYPVGLIAQTGSAYLTLCVTIERYVAVCIPLRARSLCTYGRARSYVIFIGVFAIVYNLPRSQGKLREGPTLASTEERNRTCHDVNGSCNCVFFVCNVLALVVNILEVMKISINALTQTSNLLITFNSSNAGQPEVVHRYPADFQSQRFSSQNNQISLGLLNHEAGSSDRKFQYGRYRKIRGSRLSSARLEKKEKKLLKNHRNILDERITCDKCCETGFMRDVSSVSGNGNSGPGGGSNRVANSNEDSSTISLSEHVHRLIVPGATQDITITVNIRAFPEAPSIMATTTSVNSHHHHSTPPPTPPSRLSPLHYGSVHSEAAKEAAKLLSSNDSGRGTILLNNCGCESSSSSSSSNFKKFSLHEEDEESSALLSILQKPNNNKLISDSSSPSAVTAHAVA
ncbi:unnamed protein product [Lepeophtheirus salmonis]|uniref:(salmon louse) hypothetical protein n=1 Tax=Lepeophtheirus salmonis TaxID=72036 RepID=A0A7R8CFV0_LEPSM|nr:unnamed protein product [Lepeophtheirus salmonis]CAF2804567.1 unnamed protein product [Lepeophtheirus salmonis]